MHERVAQRDDAAVAREAQLGLVPLVALLGDGEQVLAARLDEAHRPAERAGQLGDQDVLAVDDRLGPEAAADVLRDHAHGVLGAGRGSARASGAGSAAPAWWTRP